MKRDMDLIRKLLLAIEAHEHGRAPKNLEVAGFNQEQIGYHIWLMCDGGLLHVVESITLDSASPTAIPITITWNGYEFLEAAREPSRWQTAMQKMKSTGAAMTIEIITEVLSSLSKKVLGLSA